MATWKKVIVSGSAANLSALQVDNLTSGQVVIGGGSSNLTTTAINGTGNIVATTGATGVTMTGSFTGSFSGNFVGTTNLPDLTNGTGITAFTYDGATTATVAVSGASTLSTNAITKWTGNAFANSSITDNGTVISGASSIQLTGANSSLTGSFTGSFRGDGSGLTNVTATAIFPTTAKTDLASTDQFFINDGTNKFITYGNLLTDLAGTNLIVEGTDSLALAQQITVTGVTASLFGTASWALDAQELVSGSVTARGGTTFTVAVGGNTELTVGTTGVTLGNLATDSHSVTGSLNAPNITGSLFGTASWANNALAVSSIANNVTNNVDNRVLTATGGASINGEANLTFDGTTLALTGNQTISSNLTVNGNLTVAGTASFTNTDNLNVRDKFILINSGSSTLADSGWVSQYNAAGSGSAFYVESTNTGTYGRFAVAYDVLGTAASVTPDEFVVTAKINQASDPSAAPTWGGSSNGSANMWITNGGDIWVYA